MSHMREVSQSMPKDSYDDIEGKQTSDDRVIEIVSI